MISNIVDKMLPPISSRLKIIAPTFVLVITVFAIFNIVANDGGIIVMRYLDDMWFQFDSLWRSANGDIPHRDFHSPVGQAYFWPFQILASINMVGSLSIIYAQLIVAGAAVICCLILFSRRLSSVLYFAGTVLVVLTALSPRDIGFQYDVFSHLASYNRWGWSFAFIIVMAAAVTPIISGDIRSLHHRYFDIIDGLIIGLCLTFLFFLKITYFVGSGTIILVSVAMRRFSIRMLLWTAVGLALGIAASELRWHNTLAYFADLQSAIAANLNAGGDRTRDALRHLVEGAIYGTAGTAVLWIWQPMKLTNFVRQWWKELVTAAFIIITAAAIATQNHPRFESPLYHAAVLVLLEYGHRRSADRPAIGTNDKWQKNIRRAVGWVAGLIAVSYIGVIDARSVLAHSWMSNAGVACRINALQGSLLKDVLLPPRAFRGTAAGLSVANCPERDIFPTYPVQWEQMDQQLQNEVISISEIMPLLNRELTPSDRVMPLKFSNLYSAATATKPVEGSLSWWHYGRTFSMDAHPDIRKLMSSATVVLVPDFSHDLDVTNAHMFSLFSQQLQTKFVVTNQLRSWTVWKKVVSAANVQ